METELSPLMLSESSTGAILRLAAKEFDAACSEFKCDFSILQEMAFNSFVS